MTFRPLLAAKAELDKLRFPVLASPKLDGIRALILDRGLVSRSLKNIPNAYVSDFMYEHGGLGLDGELITYTDGVRDDYNTVQSKIMSKEGEPDFRFHVFDDFLWEGPFHERLYRAETRVDKYNDMAGQEFMELVPHIKVFDGAKLADLETKFVDEDGWEGVMLRDPLGKYKHGRSTAKEQILLKMKRFHDAEAIVTGFVERMLNNNEQTRDAFGLAKRSSHKENKKPAGDLGAFVCQFNGVEFELGTGFTAAQRIIYWGDLSLIGKRVTFKYQELSKDGVPRFPVFLHFRADD